MSTESTNHEGRIGRLEGINEQIDKRLSRIEKVVIGQLVMTVAILIKLLSRDPILRYIPKELLIKELKWNRYLRGCPRLLPYC